jgi:hypothetical protein
MWFASRAESKSDYRSVPDSFRICSTIARAQSAVGPGIKPEVVLKLL